MNTVPPEITSIIDEIGHEAGTVDADLSYQLAAAGMILVLRNQRDNAIGAWTVENGHNRDLMRELASCGPCRDKDAIIASQRKMIEALSKPEELRSRYESTAHR